MSVICSNNDNRVRCLDAETFQSVRCELRNLHLRGRVQLEFEKHLCPAPIPGASILTWDKTYDVLS